jgi:cellulose synthase operon protein C
MTMSEAKPSKGKLTFEDMKQLMGVSRDAGVVQVAYEDTAIVFDTRPYIEAAAVLEAFNPFTWQPDISSLGVETTTSGDADGRLDVNEREVLIDALIPLSEQVLDGVHTGLWRLTFAERRKYLRRLGTREAMRRALDANGKRPVTPLQRMFEQIVDGVTIDLNSLEREELTALNNVLQWTGGILDPLPERGAVLAALARYDLRAPMKRLVAHGFVNREEELKQLEAYVQDKARSQPLFVFGSGGVGKSTLLAQFILSHIDAIQAPFAYIDIDRSSIRPDEPLTLLLEIIGQLREQLPIDPNIMDSLVNDIVQDIGIVESGRQLESLGTRAGYREHISSLDNELGRVFAADEDGFKTVIIFVDTFEEAQWFGPSIVNGLLDFLFALNDSQNVKLVLAGRVLDKEFVRREMQNLLEELSSGGIDAHEVVKLTSRLCVNVNLLAWEPALELLRTALEEMEQEPLDEVDLEEIIKIVTCNPMAIKLAARLLAIDGMKKFKEQRNEFLAQLRAEKIQALLYGRILSHIRVKDARKVAYPGLVVRRLTPDVIREVLAKPCGLELTEARNEFDIFEDLKNEVALVTYHPADNSLRHRVDVRRVMLEDLEDHVGKDTVRQIDEAAVAYYAGKTDPASRAEEIYHRLRLKEPADALDGRWMPDAARYLKDAGEDLPAQQQLWLARKLNITLADDVRQEADQEAWEDQAARSAERYLASANAEMAIKILEERPARLPRSTLYTLHAEAYRILGSYDQALQVGRDGVKALLEARDIGQALELLLKMVVVEESRNNLAAADNLLLEAEKVAGQINDRVKKLRTVITHLRVERKIRPDAEARHGDLRQRAQDLLYHDPRPAIRRHPVLLREAAAELSAFDPQLAEVAIDTLGLETTMEEQAGALGEVLTVLFQQSDASESEERYDTVFLDRWRKSDRDPYVVQDWVALEGKDLARRLARSAGRSVPGSELLRELQHYFRSGEDVVLADVGKTYQAAGRSKEARKIYEQGLETMRRAGDRVGEARTLSNLAEISRIESEPDQALALLEQVLAIWRELGDRAEEARTLYDYGNLLLVMRRHEKAGAPFEAALAIFRELGDDGRAALTLYNLGLLWSEKAELDKALDSFQQALAIYERLADRVQEATTLNVMGEILLENGRLAEAHDVYERSLAIWRALGDRRSEADTLIELAGVAEAAGKVDEARDFFERALVVIRALDIRERETWILGELARLDRKEEEGQKEKSPVAGETPAAVEEGQQPGAGWSELRRAFADALVNAFVWDNLAVVVRIYAGFRLDDIASKNQPLKVVVDQVIENAVRRGWLQELAEGALAERPTNADLNAVVPRILEGVRAEGQEFYQETGMGDQAQPASKSPASTQGSDLDVRELYGRLNKEFNLEELRELCFILGIEFDNISGSTKAAKARELVSYMQRRGLLDELAKAIQQLRP